jgi:hypothetical protein
MIMRALLKWLVITVTVLIFFLTVLLGLGYLLKENEQVTTKLKIKTAQDTQRKQDKEARRKALFNVKPTLLLTQNLTSFEQSQQKIIADNVNCQSSKECFLVHTNSKTLGCIVAVNATGVAILLKTADEKYLTETAISNCQQNYSQESVLTLFCQNNTCSYARE